MERKIGEIFEHNGEWYQCINNGFSCADCDINGDCSDADIGACSSLLRKDCTQVRFKKLEKVGEPYEALGKLFQPYKLSENIPIPVWDVNYFMCPHWKEGIVDIEVKQNKEDMEEKKVPLKKEDIYFLCSKFDQIVKYCVIHGYDEDNIQHEFEKLFLIAEESDIKSNLKPFDLEAAKAGKPVCTRDGRKARIICFDRDWDMPIVALVSDPLGESVHYYLSNGKIDFYRQNDEDLMMLPEKKEGWVNVYKEESNNNERLIEQTIYKTRKDAFDNACPKGYITTIKIEWEE